MKNFLISTASAGVFFTCTFANAQLLVPPASVPGADGSGIVQQIQSTDSFRVNELENEIRRLNGKVEELNFLLLQLQEKFRKMEEDNESRFQELEESRSDAGGSSAKSNKQVAKTTGTERLGKPEASGEDNSSDVEPNQKPEIKSSRTTDLAPRALGTLTFDKDGNVIDGNSNGADGSGDTKLSRLPGVFNDGVDGGVEAAEFGATPSEVFNVGKNAFDLRKYPRAQQAFAAYIKAWPKDPAVGQAKYYLGEALFWQKQYYAAANAHLDAHNNYPEAETAADNLLGLGLALAGLNQREVACATYAEVLNQYPETEPRLGKRIKDEQAAAKC